MGLVAYGGGDVGAEEAECAGMGDVEAGGAFEAEDEGEGFVEGEAARAVHGFFDLVVEFKPFQCCEARAYGCRAAGVDVVQNAGGPFVAYVVASRTAVYGFVDNEYKTGAAPRSDVLADNFFADCDEFVVAGLCGSFHI